MLLQEDQPIKLQYSHQIKLYACTLTAKLFLIMNMSRKSNSEWKIKIFFYYRNEFPPKISPKQRLYESMKRAGIGKPVYDVVGYTVHNTLELIG